MATVRVKATMLDGTIHEAEGSYMGLADRVALERKYGSSVPALVKQETMLEEHVAFLAHRVLQRKIEGFGDFDTFVANVENIELGSLDDDEEDPTEPAAPVTK